MNRSCRTSAVVILIIIGVLALFPGTACASGNCDFLLEPFVDNIRDAETEVILENEMIICRVDVKAGQIITSFYEDGHGDCYTVEGINTNSVTISELGENSKVNGCQDMSNVRGFSFPPTAVTFVGIEVKGISPTVLTIVICGVIFLSLISVCVGFFLHMKGGG